jgi:hypothetical protein
MSCEGCISSPQGQKLSRQTAKDNAKVEAKKEGKPFALYQEQGEWRYINAFEAYRLNLPVEEIVSAYK